MFGTNGIREIVGEKLSASLVSQIASAAALVHGGKGPAVVGIDARTSSPALGRVVMGSLAMAGIDVIDVGVLPTPAIQYCVPRLNASFGLIVTASHNPPEFNGIKGIASDGLEFTRGTEKAIEDALAQGRLPSRGFDAIGTIREDGSWGARYVEGILSQVNCEAIRKRNMRVLLDCSNGASSVTSPLLLNRLGARYTTMNANMDGTFPSHDSEPTEENLVGLVQAVKAVGAELGVAHDGDADRAVFVDETGRYVPGEKILTLLARESVRKHGKGVVVTPVTSSDSVAEAIRPYGGTVHFTRVGSPIVSRMMKEKGGIFGGEENGGLIFAEHQLARDGAMSLAKVLETIAVTGKPLSALVAELPSYHLAKRKVKCPTFLREEVMARVPSVLQEEKPGEVTTIDGIKVRVNDGWVLVRPSGTEPILRIFSESRERGVAEKLADTVSNKVTALVASLEGGKK